MLKQIKFDNFTAFKNLTVDLSSGINIFIGENGTGKTHILKAAYASCDITKSNGDFAEKINNVFYPSNKQIGRLVKRSPKSGKGSLEIVRELKNKKKATLRLSMSNHTTKPEKSSVSGSTKLWNKEPVEAAYIPVKDMMANAPGFRSLYEEREIHFEEIYADIIRKASLPLQKGPTDSKRKNLLDKLQDAMDGKVSAKNEEFFLRNKHGELEFTLLAEGYRKLGLLWLLIQNGTLLKGSVLFWDEPETNLNPKLMKSVVEIMIELQRLGVQILLSTHDYVILKEFDLQTDQTDKLMFHALYRNRKSGEIELSCTSKYLDITPNAIDETFGDIIDREIEKSMGKFKE